MWRRVASKLFVARGHPCNLISSRCPRPRQADLDPEPLLLQYRPGAMDIFSLPFERRRKIYEGARAPELRPYLFLREGRLEQSPCLGANLGEELLEDRYISGDSGENYIRRLQ